jgi:hypothetical protein
MAKNEIICVEIDMTNKPKNKTNFRYPVSWQNNRDVKIQPNFPPKLAAKSVSFLAFCLTILAIFTKQVSPK